MIIRTDGIVIREKEAATGDKHLTLLTREAGVVTAFAGGGKSPKNKNVSSTDLLCYSDFSLDRTKKGNCYIKEAGVTLLLSALLNILPSLQVSLPRERKMQASFCRLY